MNISKDAIFKSIFTHRFVRFLFVGATGALLNLALTWFFTKFVFGQERYLDAFLIGMAGNITCNFVLNTLFTFETKTQHMRRFAGFVAYSLLISGAQYYTVKLITPLVGLGWYLVVITGVILGYAAFNFLFFKYILFKEGVF